VAVLWYIHCHRWSLPVVAEVSPHGAAYRTTLDILTVGPPAPGVLLGTMGRRLHQGDRLGLASAGPTLVALVVLLTVLITSTSSGRSYYSISCITVLLVLVVHLALLVLRALVHLMVLLLLVVCLSVCMSVALSIC
jgi:hypothetical protein